MRVADFVRYVSVGVVLLAGSCASPTLGSFADPNANYPLSVEPQYAEAEFNAPTPSAGLNPDDSVRFGAFVAGFLERGRGAISVSVPDTADAPDILGYFGEKLVSLGVPKSRILVGMHTTESARKVKIGYVGYQVKSASCGDWSANRAFSADNKPSQNFGCSTQHNIAAQMSNPYDLANMQPKGERDTTRRTEVTDKYEKGDNTAATKADSVKVSNVGN
jgi:pilus assembly protein CpaD